MLDELELPEANTPVGGYVMAVRRGNLMFVSGHGPFEDGEPRHLGRLGETLTTEEGAQAAAVVALNLLATLKEELGDLERVSRFLKLVVFVSSTPEYAEQHLVADGATDVLTRLFGEEVGRPARSAIGVAALPLGFSVEIEAVVEVRD